MISSHSGPQTQLDGEYVELPELGAVQKIAAHTQIGFKPLWSRCTSRRKQERAEEQGMMISVHPLLIPPLRQGNKVAGGNSGEGGRGRRRV